MFACHVVYQAVRSCYDRIKQSEVLNFPVKHKQCNYGFCFSIWTSSNVDDASGLVTTPLCNRSNTRARI